MKARQPASPTLAALAVATFLGTGTAGTVHAGEPLIDHQPLPCSLPGEHPRICATIADDGTIERAKVYFRPAGEPAYYWVEMELDFRQFCATLPVPEASLRKVEYHVWAVDDELEVKRTTDFEMVVDPDRACPSPSVDRDPERTSSIVVHATTRKQGKKLRGFVAEGVEFRRVRRR
jgi:hypothetical protein